MDLTALSKAAELLRRARKLDPNRVEVHQRLAAVLPSLSETEEARQEYLWLGGYYRHADDLAQARKQLQLWLDRNPDDFEIQVKLAEWNHEAGETAKAVLTLAETAERCLQQGHNQEALGALETALKFDPSRTDLRRRLIELREKAGGLGSVLEERFYLAETLLTQGKIEEARSECRRLHPAVKGHRASIEQLADLAERAGERGVAYSLFLELAHQASRAEQFREAQAFAERAQGLDPDEPAPFELLAHLFLQHRRKEEAIGQLRQLAQLHRLGKHTRKLMATLRRILSIDEEDATAREELVECLIRQGDAEAVQAERTALAQLYRRQGKNEEALNQYHRILEKSPFTMKVICDAAELQGQTGHPEAALQFYLEQAKTLDRLGAKPEAEQLLQRALKIDAERPETLEHLADLYRRMERPAQALEHLEKLATRAMQQNRFADAIRHLADAVQIAPERPDLMIRTAECHERDRQESKAAEYWNEAARLLAESGQGDRARALLEQVCSRLPEELELALTRIRLLEEARQWPEAATARQTLAARLTDRDQLPQAAEQLTLAMAHLEQRTPLLERLADLYERLGDTPKLVESLRQLADDHRRGARWQPMEETLERLLKLKPDRLDALRGLAEARARRGDIAGSTEIVFQLAARLRAESRWQEAIDLYRQGLQTAPGNLPARRELISALIESEATEEATTEWTSLARLLVETRRMTEAVEALKEAVQLQPANPRLRREYAVTLQAAGKSEQAVLQIVKLAETYASLNLPEKAIETLNEAKDNWPDRLDLRHRLADLYLKEDMARAAVRELIEVAERLEQGETIASARETLARVLEIDPECIEARQRLAELLLRLTCVEEASAEFLKIASQYAAMDDLEKASAAAARITVLPPEYQEEHGRLQQDIETRLRRSAFEKRQEQIDRLVKDGNWAEALAIYEKILEDYPDHIDAILGFARLKQKSGQRDDALALFLEAADRCRSQGHLRRARMVLEEVCEHWADSEAALERLVDVEEASGRLKEAGGYRLRIAAMKEKAGRLDLAIALSEKVLTLDRYNLEARANLGRLLSILGRTEEAYQHQLALGDLLREKDRIEEAVEAYRKASGILPADARSYKKVAELLALEGRTEEAIEQGLRGAEIDWQSGHRQEAWRQIQSILRDHPDQTAPRLLAIRLADEAEDKKLAIEHRKALAQLYQSKQQPKRAIAVLREIVESDPKDLAVRRTLAQELEKENLLEEAAREHLQIGDLYNERGIGGKAISFYRMAQKHLSDPAAVQEKIAESYLRENLIDKAVSELLGLGAWLQEKGREDDAVSAYERALEADPGNLRALHKAAQCYEAAERPDRAASIYRRMVETYLERGILGKAIEVCQNALKTIPHDTALRERLAELLTQKGALQEARKEYEAMLHYSPGDLRISMRIEKLSRRIAGAEEKPPRSASARPAAGRPGSGGSASGYDPFMGSIEPPAVEVTRARGRDGLELFQQKRYSRAIEELTAAINIWKQQPSSDEPVSEYFLALGVSCLETGKPSAAVEVLIQGIGTVNEKDRATLLEMRYQLARSYEAIGQGAEALKLWKAIYSAERDYKDVANKILWSRIGGKK